jgi:hypothetical protein
MGQVVPPSMTSNCRKGWLQETLEAINQEVTFYPKFHCELKFIEHFWCGAK